MTVMQMDGSSSLTFTASGTIRAKGSISASTTVTYTVAGTIFARGKISGGTTLTFTPTSSGGKLKGKLSADAPFSFSVSGSIRAKGYIGGETTLTFIPAAYAVDADSWEDGEDTWDEGTGLDIGRYPVGILSGGFIQFSPTFANFGDTPVVAFVERLSIKPPEDRTGIYSVTKLHPILRGDVGATIEISVGFQDSPEDTPTYEGPFTYTIGESEFVDPITSGRYLAFLLQSNDGPVWELQRYDPKLQYLGAD